MQRAVILLTFLLFVASDFLGASEDVTELLVKTKEYSPEQKLDSLLAWGWKFKNFDANASITFLKQAIELAVQLRKPSKVSKAYSFLGVAYRNKNLYDSSYIYYNNALSYALIANDSNEIAYNYQNIGAYYNYKGEYFLALVNLFKARAIFEKRENLRGLGYVYFEAGKTFAKLKNYAEAIKFFKKSIRIRSTLNDRRGLFMAKCQLVATYIDKGDVDVAEKMMLELLPEYKAERYLKREALLYRNLAKIKFYRKKYKDAISLFRKSLDILIKKKMELEEIDNYIGLAQASFALGDTSAAYRFIDKAEKIADKYNYFEGIIACLETRLTFAEKKKNINQIRFYTNKLISLKDSLYHHETKLRNAEFQKVMKLKDLVESNSQLKTEIESKRKLIVIIIIAIILFVSFVVIIASQNSKLKKSAELLSKAIEDKNKLFSIVAHDLKNPFTSLLGYSEMLLEDLKGDYSITDIKNGIKQMRAAAQSLLDMVENLLQWARSQTGKIVYSPKVYDMTEIALETIAALSQSAKVKEVELKFEMKSSYSKCYCDKEMIIIALRNLIINAIKFCRKHDKIRVTVDRDLGARMIIVSVEDTGVGMSREQLEKVFWNDSTTLGTSGEKGTGLGMALVKEMVEKNGGKIFVDSKKGVGTKFTFTIPMA